MPILNEDIKILKSAVMLDTTDGGGAMTGVEVVGGESNNIFPDTSQINHAVGNVSIRKVFGVAQSPDDDQLLGAHVMIAQPPEDSLVHCLLMAAGTWAEQRAAARTAIERYVVKSTRYQSRVMETHYAGSLVLRLLSLTGTDFPPPGEVLVIANNTTEQFLQIKKVSVAEQSFTVSESSAVVTFPALVATCELGQPLAVDFTGPPIQRTGSTNPAHASVYSTSLAAGARFYGIKPLSVAAAVGDLGVKAPSIFSPLVPAADAETPLLDQHPFALRPAISASTTKTLLYSRSFGTAFAYPNDTFLCAFKPGTLSVQYGGPVLFTDDGQGNLKSSNGGVYGTVDYSTGELTWLPAAQSYFGGGASVISLQPATRGSANQKSAFDLVTVVNQGLSYTKSLSPAPALRSVAVSYMAQGRWYTLADDGTGKLSGGDSAIGVGSVSYATGSVAVTFGALPDVGSAILYQWGEANGAVDGTLLGGLPTVFEARITLGALVDPASVVVTWSLGPTNYTATVNAAGVVSGGALGYLLDGVLHFRPTYLPLSGAVNVAFNNRAAQVDYTASGNNLTLTNAPVTPGTVRLNIGLTPVSYFVLPDAITIVDDGGGNMRYGGAIVGGINYTTGAITISSPVTLASVVFYGPLGSAPATEQPGSPQWVKRRYANMAFALNGVHSGVTYTNGSPTAQNLVAPLVWTAQIPLPAGMTLGAHNIVFSLENDVYTSEAGVLRKGVTPSTLVAAGTVAPNGLITVTSLPSNNNRTPVWINLPVSLAAPAATAGVFRTATAPLREGQFQLIAGAQSASVNNAGVLSGGGFAGQVDFARGWVEWSRAAASPIDADTLSYNTVFLQSVPLDQALLGIDAVRLPPDGRVPIFRPGMLCVVHNTQVATLTNPITKGVAYALGRVRIAAVEMRDSLGALVAGSLYDLNYDAGEVTVKVASDITGFTQPFKVSHRIEDILVCSDADISGSIKFTRSLTHAFPANTSYVSGALVFGDVFARAFNYIEQSTWTNVWSDTLVGSAPLANFNEALHPIVVTNDGAITDRWLILFTSTTAFRVIGQQSGEIATGNTAAVCAPLNPATGQPYFTIPAGGWGSGWAAGNALRFNTNACGAPFWVVRTVLQGPPSLASDEFTLAFRGDVDTPAP